MTGAAATVGVKSATTSIGDDEAGDEVEAAAVAEEELALDDTITSTMGLWQVPEAAGDAERHKNSASQQP